jgi:hypothetical protein
MENEGSCRRARRGCFGGVEIDDLCYTVLHIAPAP